MTYRSPFGTIDTDHDWPDALCLSRTHCVNAPEETFGEFYAATIAVIEAGTAQPAFFLCRHMAELSLKALLGPNHKKVGHDLGKLLAQLEERGDDLLGPGQEQRLVADFIRDMHRIDPKGDEGRYATTTGGTPSLATVCCADPALLRAYVDLLFTYTQSRLVPVGQPA
ncbi:hypothetical protein ABT096_38290 [Streptomyces sp. NPDC002561]|uniref:hypothetical protein n=1 Tax=Streptomyces sp. NPDC002561 TaxID=3154418 RepID=UPI003322D3A9